MSNTPAPDRLQLLLAQNQLTGIDFVYVHADQVTLDVYFLRSPATLANPLVNDPNFNLDQVSIYLATDEERRPAVRLTLHSWETVDNRDVLRLTASAPGGFVLYRLHIEDARLDRYFNDIVFSFKANCPSDLDCEPDTPDCPPEELVDFPVDYRARDFWSFRRALLDFASQRYPDWLDRLEADAGIMLTEVFSALGDELSYYQDRISREAYLETATQRRSIRRHARMVDYPVHDGLGGMTWLDFTIQPGAAQNIPAGTHVWALSDRNETFDYEVGRGLRETVKDVDYRADPARNSIPPHIWDEDDACLKVGATELYVKGHHVASLPLDDGPPENPGRWVMLKTDPPDPSMPARRWMVRLVQVVELDDPLVNDPLTGNAITHLVWEDDQALPFELDMGFLELRGNLLPSTAGRSEVRRFMIGPSDDQADHPEAVERLGPDGTVTYLFSLPESSERGLVFLGPEARGADPEIDLVEVDFDGTRWVPDEQWYWRRSLVSTDSSQPGDHHYTLDDGTWQRVVGYQRMGEEYVHVDYAFGAGFSIRFGDGEFGLIPPEGTIFQVTYRLGKGRRDNLPPDSLVFFDPALTFVQAVTNPLPIINAQDPETPAEVRLLAPEDYRYITYRAVRPEDYAEAAERLEWVQRAGATFRWTGSWLSAFVTPDPRGAPVLEEDRRGALVQQLDRFRQAGREAHALDPVYADLDFVITVCVEPSAYAADVKESILEALLGRKGPRPRPGFFSSDNFTFGTALQRSALEATIQSVPGVRAVEDIEIRRRGRFNWQTFNDLTYEVAPNEVIRLENDPLFPERGSLRVVTEGGA
jgi:hypothetical protein